MSDREQRRGARGMERGTRAGGRGDSLGARHTDDRSPGDESLGHESPGNGPFGDEPLADESLGEDPSLEAAMAAESAPPAPRVRLFAPRWLGAAAAAAVVACGGIFFLATRQALGGQVSLLEPRTLLCLGAASLATLGLAALAWWGVQVLALRTQLEHDRLRGLLTHVSGLTLDSEAGWQDAQLAEEPELARFLAGLQARDHGHRQELTRYARLEIELGRLGASLLSKDRNGVSATYAQPTASRLASGAALLYEEIDGLRRELAQAQAHLEQLGGQAAEALNGARRWQACAQDEMTAQVEEVRALAGAVQRTGVAVEERAKALAEARDRGAPSAGTVLEAMPALAAGDRAAALTQAAHNIKDLVARGGSLAIQTALEVTRLGERGETLFPLTESLKALVTDFQAVATQMEKLARDQESAKAALQKVHGLLTELRDAPEREAASAETWGGLSAQLGDLKLALVRLGADLGGMLPGYGEQSERLDGAAGALSELTGQPLPEPALAPPETHDEDGFQVESFAAPKLAREVAPAAPRPAGKPEPAPAERPDAPATPRVASFEPLGLQGSSAPERAGPKAWPADETPAWPAAAAEARPAAKARVPAAAVTPIRPAEGSASPGLSREDDRIYDLAEFDAVALDGDPEAAPEEEERVYDLSEFGAVALA